MSINGFTGRLMCWVVIFIALTSFTACTSRDVELEKLLTEKFEQLKSSKALSMDLNDVLDKNWRKFCVQSAYDIKKDFNKDSGEQVNRLLDISENELAIWVFYNDDSIQTAILQRNLLDFRVSTSEDGSPMICASKKNSHLYISEYKQNEVLVRKAFYFKINDN
ncbi:MAG: hypothetical protein Q8L68_06345 [Methylococcales bacterium]|nr:hypothetical protein [Methylococcales bacterium]